MADGVADRAPRIRDAGVDDGLILVQADGRSLPFETDFFDAIVSIDSFPYYGTDDLYLNYLARFLKPGGVLGIAGEGVMQEIDVAVPDHLRNGWGTACAAFTRPRGGATTGRGPASWRSGSPTRLRMAGMLGGTG